MSKNNFIDSSDDEKKMEPFKLVTSANHELFTIKEISRESFHRDLGIIRQRTAYIFVHTPNIRDEYLQSKEKQFGLDKNKFDTIDHFFISPNAM